MFRCIVITIIAGQLLFFSTSQTYAVPLQQPVTIYEGVVNENANIRSGPGLEHPVVAKAKSGQLLNVVACNEDCAWLQLDDGNWIAAFLVDLIENPNNTDDDSVKNGGVDPDELVVAAPSQSALDMVQQIVSYTGLPQNFEIYSANIYNAAAMIVEGQRVIFYDPELISDMETSTQNRWSGISIFAHEIGHHLAGHTLHGSTDSDKYSRQHELEADYFSGFILYKMGASLVEAQSAMSQLRDHPYIDSYPSQIDRLGAIEGGWREAAYQKGREALPPPPPDIEDEYSDIVAGGYLPMITESETFPDGYGLATGCWAHEDFTVMYVFEVLPEDMDSLWRGYILEDARGERKHYILSLADMSNATRSWVPTIMEPGRRLKIASAICGNGGWLFLSYVEPLPAATYPAAAFELPDDTSANTDSGAQVSSTLLTCAGQNFDTTTYHCTKTQTLFAGTVERVYVSWIHSEDDQYSGSEYHQKWYLDDIHILDSRSPNEFAYIETSYLGGGSESGLKSGRYRIELNVEGRLVEAVEFTIE